MTTRFDAPVVNFVSPPVVEVVVGVGLAPGGPDLGPLLADFWQRELRGDYPDLQYQPPYVPVREEFNDSSIGQHSLQIDIGPAVPFPRIWAQSHDKLELVQLHPRYFACNWRRVQPEAKYDHWAARRQAFEGLLRKFVLHCERSGTTLPAIEQCEVTYVNHIRAGTVWSKHSQWARIFDVQFGSKTPYPVERLSADVQFVITDADMPVGRLYCKVAPARDTATDDALYGMELTARGAPRTAGLSGALEFLDLAREAIDKTFVSLTTEAMHQEWGMKQ